MPRFYNFQSNEYRDRFDTTDEFKLAYMITLEDGDYTHIGCRPALYYHMKRIVQDIGQLRGKGLACWCKLGNDCHADFLLEVANEW